MSRIRGKDTTPEKVVRSLLHRMGYRFRLHVRIPIPTEIASKLRAKTDEIAPKILHSALRNPHSERPAFHVRPDILLPKYKTATFVHGCESGRKCRADLPVMIKPPKNAASIMSLP
jgi:G:T-mismatch repair DNA endonuclease (very short patch repair protein)